MTATAEYTSSALDPRLIDQCLLDLADGLRGHPAIENDFYRSWIGGALGYPAVKSFAEQYVARTVNTSVMVALSVLNTEDLAARVECVRNLYSEYGNGDATKAHLVLLENFFADLLTRLSNASVSPANVRGAKPLPSTEAFSAGQREMFSSSDQRTVQGALLAQEHLAYSMLTRLYEGVRNYKSVYETDEAFHEACEYFYVHIGEAEKEHKAEALVSAAAVCHSEADLEVVTAAFKRFADLTAEYWAGVHSAMAQAVA